MDVTKVISGAAELVKLVKRVRDAKLQEEMLQKVIDVQNECVALQSVNATLRQENDKLRQQLDAANRKAVTRSKLRGHGDVYVLKDELGERYICPVCFHKEGWTIPIALSKRRGRPAACPSCKATFPVLQ